MTQIEETGRAAAAATHNGVEPSGPTDSAAQDPLLAIVSNLSQHHREHEKYYSEAPLHDAISLQRCARTLIALAEYWDAATPPATPVPSPVRGCH